MARISLLFSLAFSLTLGSLFLSVSSHAPPAPTTKLLCPKTVSELQTLPFTEIAKILNKKESLAPKTAEFKAMFTMCKGYVAYLESLYKFENPIVDVLGIAKTKYALTTKAILAAQASVSGKVDKKTSLKLRKSCAGFKKGFLQIQKAIVKISAKHNYKADSKINLSESKIIGDAMMTFKNSINAFMDVVNNLEKKNLNRVGYHARALREDEDDGFRRFWRRFADRYGGYMGARTHGRDLSEAEFSANSHVGAEYESTFEKFVHLFDGYLGGTHPHGRELTEAQVRNNTDGKVNGSDQSKHDKFYQFFCSFLEGKPHGRELTEAQDGGKVNNLYEEFTRYISHLGGKAHGRKLLESQAGVNAGAQAGGKINLYEEFTQYISHLGGKAHLRKLLESQAGGKLKGSVEDFLNYNSGGFGEKVQIDADGKMKVAGKDGFMSLNRAHYKHFVSKDA